MAKREPSIHISKTLFYKLWNEMGGMISEEFVDKFFTKARQYSLDHRSVVGENKKVQTQWASVKELVPVVNEFCQKFGFEPRQGYIEFVTTGIKLMSQAKRVNYNFCANWLHQRVNWIMDVYEADKEVKEDKHPEYTREVYEHYTKEILDRIGINNTYDKNPQEYVWFVRARKLADEIVYLK